MSGVRGTKSPDQRLTFRDARAGDGEDIRGVVTTVLTEYGLSRDGRVADTDLEDVLASYVARGGLFRVLVTDTGRIVGCGGLYPLSDDEAEVRKMYFLPEARGLGLGRMLLQDLVACARQRGFKTLVLETASVLKQAISLYRSVGFVETPRSHLTPSCDKGFRLSL